MKVETCIPWKFYTTFVCLKCETTKFFWISLILGRIKSVLGGFPKFWDLPMFTLPLSPFGSSWTIDKNGTVFLATCEIFFQFRCRSQIGQRRLRQWLTLGMLSFLTAANLMGYSCNNGAEGAKQETACSWLCKLQSNFPQQLGPESDSPFLLWDRFKVLPGCFVAKVFGFPSSFYHDPDQTDIDGVYDWKAERSWPPGLELFQSRKSIFCPLKMTETAIFSAWS